ncbi:MAG TPA: hypothetical protein VNJ47_04675 [Nevskiales bacterium]|nr:hypothetical protein [Nevskiales bacterium]
MPALMLTLLLLPAAAGAALNEEVLRTVEACTATATSFEQQRACAIKATPRKCRKHVRGRPQQGLSLAIRQVWLKCISTCEGANLYSRTLGECSRPSDPDK